MPQPADIRDANAWQRKLEEEKLAALAEFAAGAGHEINNPLAVICGRAELLLRQETHPERRRDLATIHAQARRVYEMIADLMLFARPPRPVLAPLDLAALLNELVVELGPRCQERGVHLDAATDGEPVEVRADRGQLLVALRAVCDNALDALGQGGRLEIRSRIDAALKREKGKGNLLARIEIHDDGPGFDDDVRRHLFDPFFSGRAAGRGLGMGLAKCWRIVRLHEGTIDVESQPGQGATFAISLPATRVDGRAKLAARGLNGAG
jgi:signal transduction histidine kinase